MKRIHVRAALLSLCLLGGCGTAGVGNGSGCQSVPPTESAVPFADGQLYALAWLGWQEPADLAYYQQQYLDGASLPVHHISDGDYYLIIPRGPGADVKLYQTDPESGDWTLLYEETDCGPFLLQCNVSDIFPDAVVSVTRDGLYAEFSPYLSLEDGSVQAGDLGLDLTRTPPAEEASSAG